MRPASSGEPFFSTQMLQFLIIYLLLLARHFLLALPAHIFFILRPTEFWKNRKIQPNAKATIVREEIKWSFLSAFVQAMFFYFLYEYDLKTGNLFYEKLTEQSVTYTVATFLGFFIWHDFYFYWNHRLLHQKWVYKNIHIIHHNSRNPTAFAAGSCHPIEAFLEMFFVLPYLMIFPQNIWAFLLFLVLTEISNISGHTGVEMAPKGAWDKWWGRWLTTNTHHNLHHQYPNGNYAIYGRFWDVWFGTLNAKTGEEFRRVTEHHQVGS